MNKLAYSLPIHTFCATLGGQATKTVKGAIWPDWLHRIRQWGYKQVYTMYQPLISVSINEKDKCAYMHDFKLTHFLCHKSSKNSKFVVTICVLSSSKSSETCFQLELVSWEECIPHHSPSMPLDSRTCHLGFSASLVTYTPPFLAVHPGLWLWVLVCVKWCIYELWCRVSDL